MPRATIATLSTENLLHNVEVLRARAPNSQLMAMVKANAYGHGIRSVSQRLQGRVDALGVASIDEAMALRKAGVAAPITLIEGVFEPSELLLAAQEGFTVVFHEQAQLAWLKNATLPHPIKTWVKIDTGMGRLGFEPEEGLRAHALLSSDERVHAEVGLMSHFACADEADHTLNTLQMQRFSATAATLIPQHIPTSMCNSAGMFQFPQAHGSWVRPGLALYGASPVAGKTAAELGLKPVMTLQTALIAVRMMRKGEALGYGARFVCPEDMPVGVIAVGYGDGYSRTAQDSTPMLVNGVRCSVVGRVSMDMTMIDLRPCFRQADGAQVGDPVVLWGEGLPVEEVAAHTSCVAYDLLCGVQNRVKFQWTAHDMQRASGA